MGHTIPRQHPAVVLRSQYRALRALLAMALVAVATLGATVAILATDGDAGGAPAALTSTPAVHGKATPLHARADRGLGH